MTRKKRSTTNIHESFADVALLTLATFIFLFVSIMITTRLSEQKQVPELEAKIKSLQKQIQSAQTDKKRLAKDLKDVVVDTPDDQLDKILKQASMGRKDFDLFIKGLKDIRGDDIHLVVDATGSMHSVSAFLIPILRVIFARSGKRLDAITWFSDYTAETYVGSMGEMFDQLMKGAPFSGSMETIGKAFRIAEQNAPPPGAYLVIGDEQSNDTIEYSRIPSPVFTLALGRSDPELTASYKELSSKTGGKMLEMELK
ncbi:MAG TPA: hypothetical protein VKA13_02770 [Gammaproteobacteria bacterium]|nr:hypothetical protein [Gammaproteobacteria bacterium]